MSTRVHLYIRADIEDPPGKVDDWLKWLKLGTNQFADGNFLTILEDSKLALLEKLSFEGLNFNGDHSEKSRNPNNGHPEKNV